MSFYLRFHLGRGSYFMHWQLKEDFSKKVLYFDFKVENLILEDCQLISKKNAANKIYTKETNRQPCGWIKCEKYYCFKKEQFLKQRSIVSSGLPIYYNPKLTPYWVDSGANNIDDYCFDRIITINNKLFAFNQKNI